jgi:hypothetical protein
MQVEIGKDGLEQSWQDKFAENVACVHCNESARIGFVAHEFGVEEGSPYVCNLHNNEKDNMWVHDACAVAVYFCTKCLNTTAIYNQA